MCGRFSLNQNLKQIQCNCKISNFSKNLKIVKLENLCKNFEPSYNVSPLECVPVLVSAKHFDKNANSGEVVLTEMVWRMIPRWHKGDYRNHEFYASHNSRVENIRTSKMYLPAFKKGRRCVMLCDGFFEWQNTNRDLKNFDRPAFYIYMSPFQGKRKKDEAKNTSPLMKIAGIFDIWYDEKRNPMYSFTIITQESGRNLDWLHNRCPAILETDQQVADWLDFERVPTFQSLKIIRTPKDILWHRVSDYVNNPNHKDEKCIEPIKIEEDPKNIPKKKKDNSVNLSLYLKRKADNSDDLEPRKKRKN